MSATKKEKVAVLVSGGVDSSVAASMLKKMGKEITGVFIKITPPFNITCTEGEERQSAIDVCTTLKIPFIEIDATKEYKEKVIDKFIEVYKKGDTPNPDVLCNTFIKFDFVLDKLKELGFSIIATGHYAKVKNGKLYRAKDENKDQTYFLYELSKDKLENIIFPLEDIYKDEVRKYAKKEGLSTYKKKDSIGICFLGNIPMKTFLKEHIKEEQGDVYLTDEKKVVGSHNGVRFYTIGQRKGYTTNLIKETYVVEKDIEKNVLYVSYSPSQKAKCSYKIKNVILRDKKLEKCLLLARFRHRGKLFNATLNKNEVIFEDKVSISSGQSIVLYKEDGECIGGGVVS